MSFEEEFDSIIRQKMGEADFPFDEKNWEKARGIVDAQRKTVSSRNNGKLYAAALLLLCLSIAGWVAFNRGRDTSVSVQSVVPAKSVTKISAAELSSPPLTENNSITHKQINNPPSPATGVLISQAEKAKPAYAAVNNNPVISEGQAKTPSIETTEVAATMSGKESANDAENAARAKEVTAASAGEEKQVPETAQTPAGNEDKAIAEKAVNAAPAITETQQTFEPVEQLSPMTYQVISPEAELMPVAFNHLASYDEDYYKHKKFKTHFLNIEAGGSYLAGWDAKNGKDGKGFGWYGGLNYGVYLSQKVAVSLGLQAYNIGHISDPFYTNSNIEYGFGVTSSQTVITSCSLYYAAIPVKFYYTINPQNQFGIGANVGMLVSSANTVESYDLSDNVKINSVKSTNQGVYQGMNTMNVLLSAFYKTQLGKRLYLNGEVMYGVSSLFNAPSTIHHTQAPGVRLGLQYTLFDK